MKENNYYEEIREKINKILLDFSQGKLTKDETINQLFEAFSVRGMLPDTLEDENSEIYQIGKEIAEMSEEEFENSCKIIDEILSKANKNMNKL